MSAPANTIPQIDGAPAPAPPIAAPLTPAAPTTGAAAAAQQQAPAPRDTFAPRKFGPAPVSANPGLPEALRLVATSPLYTVKNLVTSTYIPTTINIFTMLHVMDASMIHTHKFTQSNPHWHPLVSQLYVSLIIYVHIIRCMIESDSTNLELANFYEILYHNLGLDNLMVPGPLVPFLAAMTLCSSPHEWIGNICPTIPLVTGATAANGFRLNNRVYQCLPSIPFIIDQLHELIANVDDATTAAAYRTYMSRVEHIFTATSGDNDNAKFNLITPTAFFRNAVPLQMAKRFVENSDSIALPSRLNSPAQNADTHTMDYLQFFGFSAYHQNGIATNWLTSVGPVMSTYSTFFKNSVSLTSISPTGLGASLPVATYKASSRVIPNNITLVPAVAQAQNVAAVPAHYTYVNVASNAVSIEHAAPPLSELAEQYASLALVNCDFTVADAASTHLGGPTNATLRQGPYWNLPTVRKQDNLDTHAGFANNVAAYYHSPVPVRN